MAYRLFVDSDNGVTLYPAYDYSDRSEKVESRHVTRSGREFVYKWGDRVQIRFGVSFINSSDRAIVNSWWNTNTDLLFMEEGATQVNSVRLVNDSQPIDSFVRPYSSLFRGTIELGSY